MQVLPLGIQTFSEIIERDNLYVDKTQQGVLANPYYYRLSNPFIKDGKTYLRIYG